MCIYLLYLKVSTLGRRIKMFDSPEEIRDVHAPLELLAIPSLLLN